MNLIQKVIKKMEKKIDEIFFTRKLNNFIEHNIIECEEIIQDYEERIESNIKANDINAAYLYYTYIQDKKEDIKRYEAFKEYMLKDLGNDEN